LAVPVPDAVPAERARLLAAAGGAALSAAVARLVLRRARGRAAVVADPGAGVARDRAPADCPGALPDARRDRLVGVDDAARGIPRRRRRDRNGERAAR